MYRLLILDDERKIAEGIANLFPWEQIGFESVFFSSPEKALQYMRENKVDVLLTDIEMPGLTGIELAEKLEGMGVRIIFISSHQNYGYFRSAITLHVEDYLLKPLKGSDVLSCFEKIKE